MPESNEIRRLDRYTVEIKGVRVRATEDQEQQLQRMTPDDLDRFLRIMTGGTNA